MTRKRVESTVDFASPAAQIVPSRLQDEISDSFLDYAYAVIGGRALPDARDGLKPVHRRILFTMSEMGLVPSHAYVKCGRVVGEVMGKLHPHGDSAIYEALVRMAQDFSMSVPFVDGHGNFGSLDSGPAASRYTECRLLKSALGMVTSVAEDTVDMVPNYDGSLLEPSVLPAAYPNLLVNGSTGIAVGMATNMAPHNLEEAVAAARFLLAKPKATLDDLMAIIPGPDFPGGCEIITGEGVREAFESGKGAVTMRAIARIQPLEGSRGRNEIVVTALPYGVGTEKVVEGIRKGIAEKRITFVSDVIDLTEGDVMALHIELKTGVNAEQALASLYALTPMEAGFSISNLALVDGQPRTLGLIEMLSVFLEFRREIILRRSEFRRAKAQARLHLVDGLLIVMGGLDEAIRIIRRSKATAEARDALMKKFKLSEAQATYVLDTPLRRLTALETESLLTEKRELEATIADLTDIIENPKRLVKVVDGELADYVSANPSPRKSTLVGSVATVPTLVPVKGSDAPVVIADSQEYTWHLLADGTLSTVPNDSKDVVLGRATVTGSLLLLCADGVAVKVPAGLSDGMRAEVAASRKSPVVGLAGLADTIIMGTKRGQVKALKGGDFPQRGDEHSFVALDAGDEVLWAGVLVEGSDAVFVTDQASLLRFPASAVRPQGRSGGGMAGIKLADGASAIAFAAVDPSSTDLATFVNGRGKVTAVSEYPTKGRATGGVRCHTFRKGESTLDRAAIVPAGGAVPNEKGRGVKAPARQKRDGSGA